MYRSDQDQSSLSHGEQWYRAATVGGSSHASGAAFDISLRSHYRVEQGQIQAVATWNETRDFFNPFLFLALEEIARKRMNNGECNAVKEQYIDETTGESAPTCLHICVAPEK